MVVFWSIVALLLAGALLFVLPPLLRPPGENERSQARALTLAVHREQLAALDADLAAGAISAEHHVRERAELERRVAEELPLHDESAVAGATTAARPGWLALGSVALVVPLVALAVYGVVGQPDAVVAVVEQAGPGGKNAHDISPEQMRAMVDRLAERLKQNPGDADGWHMLARSYAAFGRFPESAQAYAKAVALVPGDPQLLADFADMLAMVNNRNLDGRPTELINEALKIDPKHQKSLALAGTAAFNRKDFAGAIGYWQRLQQTLPPDSDGARSIGASIAEAKSALGTGGAAVAAAAPVPTAQRESAPAAAGSLSGRVTLSESLRSKVGPNDMLYVFARAVEGPRMPIAIMKVPAKSFPFDFTLDDGMAMTPQMKLSGQTQVAVGARISRTGNATPQSGDLMGTLSPVAVGSRNLALVIDTVVP